MAGRMAERLRPRQHTAGMRFGQLEVKAVAAEVLRRFRLALAKPGRELSIRQMPTLSPRGGLPVLARARYSR